MKNFFLSVLLFYSSLSANNSNPSGSSGGEDDSNPSGSSGGEDDSKNSGSPKKDFNNLDDIDYIKFYRSLLKNKPGIYAIVNKVNGKQYTFFYLCLGVRLDKK